jgi:hypothetical protein
MPAVEASRAFFGVAFRGRFPRRIPPFRVGRLLRSTRTRHSSPQQKLPKPPNDSSSRVLACGPSGLLSLLRVLALKFLWQDFRSLQAGENGRRSLGSTTSYLGNLVFTFRDRCSNEPNRRIISMCDSSIGRMDSHSSPRLTHTAPPFLSALVPLSPRWINTLGEFCLYYLNPA